LLRPDRVLDDRVARAHDTLFEHAEIEAGPAVLHEQCRHAWLVHAYADPVTGHPWLRHLEQRRADLVPVADTHLVVVEPVDGEVLTELPEHEVVALEVLAPVAVRTELVDVDR